MKVELKKLGIHKKSNEKSNRPVYALGCDSNDLDDEDKDIYVAEFVWSSKDKPSTCASLKLIHKNRQDDVKFTFDVAKCDKIFDFFRIWKVPTLIIHMRMATDNKSEYSMQAVTA
jgi:hypothetical protein